MATREFELNQAEITELERAEQATRQVLVLRRRQAVRLYGSGKAMSVITDVVQASERTVRRWISMYPPGGIGGLNEQRKGGNNCQLSTNQRAQLADQLRQYRPVDLQISQNQ